jgi:hypothetical protein
MEKESVKKIRMELLIEAKAQLKILTKATIKLAEVQERANQLPKKDQDWVNTQLEEWQKTDPTFQSARDLAKERNKDEKA